MRELIIGDVHFGVRANSTRWLDIHKQLFEKFIFNIVKKNLNNLDRIVFLGDLTDIRYAINQQIGIELKDLIRQLCELFNKDIIFVAGNHDFYSPIEESNKYNSYELLFGKEFTIVHPNVHFITTEPYLSDDGSLFLPWYWTENPEHFDDILYRYDIKRDVNVIYCHADLTVWPGPRIASIHGKPIYSGHIHWVVNDNMFNLHNVGAVMPLTFNDVNQDRFVYILEDYNIVHQIPNDVSPKFKSVKNEEIFSDNEYLDELFENSFVMLMINSTNINQARYVERIKELRNLYPESYIRIHIIEDTQDQQQDVTTQDINMDIFKYIDSNIPEQLSDKYNIVKEKVQETINIF